MRGGPWTRQDIAKLKRLHAQGRSWGSIAEALGRSKQACQTRFWLVSHGRPKAELPEDEDDGLENLRRCHDCGCPTHNFRCARCRRKWQIKNGAPLDETIQNMHAD